MTSPSTRRSALARAALLAATVLLLSGCTGTAGDQSIADTAPTDLSGSVSLWHFFSDREADVIQAAADDFEKAHPNVTVDVHAGQDDEKLRKAIASGSTVDLGISYSTDIVGSFCGRGAFRDLGPYIERDRVDLAQFSDTVRSYTEYNGIRCAMPVLADVYGLYYNTELLSAAG